MHARGSEQRLRRQVEQTDGQRRVGKLMLRGLLQPADGVVRRRPPRHRVEQPELAEVIAIRDRGGLRRLAPIAAGGRVQ